MDTLWQDIRYGVRMLFKRPGFTAVAAISLALGIGANTAIFAVVDSFLWRPFPVQDADRLVTVNTSDPKNPGFLPLSTLNYEDLRDQNQVFTGMACYGFAPMDLTVGGEAERIFGLVVSGNYFDVLGVRFSRGRGFRPEEAKTLGSQAVVVVSHGLWERRFGSDPNLVGRTITINAHPYTVVGISPAGFDGTFPGFHPAVYVPYTMRSQIMPDFAWFSESRRGLWLFSFARLKPGLSLEQAQAGLRTVMRQLEQQYPVANKDRSVSLLTLAEARLNPAGAAQNPVPLIAGLMLAVVGVVLLIACANVANLLLARAASRRKEIAVRLALGASRSRLVRQLLTESILLALLGGALGLAVAFWARDLLLAFQPPGFFGFSLEADIGGRVLGFTLGISLLTALLFGLAPALQASRPDVQENLKEGGRQSSEGAGRNRLRNLLVVSEVALAVVALVGAGLFVRSLRNAMAIDPGFNPKNVVTLNLDVSLEGYNPARGEQFYRDLLERVRNISGVKSATLATVVPMSGGGLSRTVILEGQVPSENERGVLVNVDTVDPKYFSTLQIPLLRGRGFEESDDAQAPLVAVVNETMAKRFWPNQDALGKRFQFPGGADNQFTPLIEVVGIARNCKYNTLGEDPIPYIYLPFRQDYNAAMSLFVRTAANPDGMLPQVRRAVRSLDAGLPVFNVQTLREQIRNSLFLPRAGAYMLGVLGLLALTLAAVGIYGVISYSVAQRTHEIGIRMALGAQQGNILRLVVRQGMLLVLIGAVIGLGLAMAASRLIASLLYGVEAADPFTFIGITLLLASVALVACYLPARRAAQVDPMLALRYE